MRCAGLAVVLIPALAHAQKPPIVGGENAPAGAWPDATAVLVGGTLRCTATLIAPSLVLTAAHCWDAPLPDTVWIGTSSLAKPAEGETIAIARAIVSTSQDLALLVLARPAIEPPRALATGWAQFDIANGAGVEIVGFGAIDKSAMTFVKELQQAATTITDADCSTRAGCRAGELGAGGMGTDTCTGDSGGPLYLVTSYGVFLAGVTSRSYDDVTLPCSQGTIYERPDQAIDWIEQAGPVARGPEPTADPIVATIGDAGDTQIQPNDPRDTGHRYKVTTPPTAGRAQVGSGGVVHVCVDPGASPGSDSLVVAVTDKATAARSLAITIPIAIQDGVPPATPCKLDDGGGCCDTGGSPGSIPLAIAILAVLRRRAR